MRKEDAKQAKKKIVTLHHWHIDFCLRLKISFKVNLIIKRKGAKKTQRKQGKKLSHCIIGTLIFATDSQIKNYTIIS